MWEYTLRVRTKVNLIPATLTHVTPILVILPPKIRPYPTSQADIVELGNCFNVKS